MEDGQVVELEVQQQGNLSILIAEYELDGTRVSDSVPFRTSDLTIPVRQYLEKPTSLEATAQILAENMIESGARMWLTKIVEPDNSQKLPYSGRSRVKRAFDSAYVYASEGLEESIGHFIDLDAAHDAMFQVS